MFVQKGVVVVLEILDSIFDISAKDDSTIAERDPYLVLARYNWNRLQSPLF